MSITIRPAHQRGFADHGWLQTFHSFSFADYHDSAHMGFRALRVINDDIVQGGGGFGMHGHRDMEIITYMLRGTLAHRDTTGGQGTLRPGDVQYMVAGTGIRHSEVNASPDEPLRLLQIWILPARPGLAPFYTQTSLSEAGKHNTLRLVAGPGPGAGTGEMVNVGPLTLHQDVRLYDAQLESGQSVAHTFAAGRGGWVQMVSGTAEVNGVVVSDGDGVALEQETVVTITGREAAGFLLFDLG